MNDERLDKLEVGFCALVDKVTELEIELDAHHGVMAALGIDHGYSPAQLETMLGEARKQATERYYLKLEDRLGPEIAAMADKRSAWPEEEQGGE